MSARTLSFTLIGIFVVVLIGCNDSSNNAPVYNATGSWLLTIQSDDGFEVFPYGDTAAVTEVNGTVTMSFRSTAIATPATEIWKGQMDNKRTVHFTVTFKDSASGGEVVSEDLKPVATFNETHSSFRTETWERRDSANNLIGYYLYVGNKIE